jgi:hypothetical protein
MVVVPNDGKYNQIAEKVKKRLRYERLGEFNVLLFMFYLFVPTLIALPFIIFLNVQLGNLGNSILVSCGIVFASGIIVLVQKKLKEYPIGDDEWAIYYTQPLCINLEKYIDTKPSEQGMRRDYKKKALRYAEGLFSCVQERWKVGTFKPIKDYEKGAVSEFGENVRYRIIPAIESRDDDILKKTEGIVYDFLAIAHNLNIEDIRKLNEKMSAPDTGLPNLKPFKIGYVARFWGYLKSHKPVQHILVGGSIAAACIILGYELLLWGASKDSVLNDTIVLFGILISAYVAIQWSQRK